MLHPDGSLPSHRYQSRYGLPAPRRGVLEERVLRGAVVHDVVDDHSDAARMGLRDEFVEVGDGAVVGLDGAVVGHRVAVVVVLALRDGHQPHALDAEVAQVVEPAGEALQVALAVAVAVLVAADEDLHERAVLPAVRQRAARVRGGHVAHVDGRRRRGRRRRAAATAATAGGQRGEEHQGGRARQVQGDVSRHGLVSRKAPMPAATRQASRGGRHARAFSSPGGTGPEQSTAGHRRAPAT
jgi:hypothetical protein